MYAVDLHAHTRFFHGRRGLGDWFDPFGHRALATVAKVQGIDGIATTNHDYYTSFPDAVGVTTLPGIEITTSHGHVVVVGPDPPEETEPGELTPAEAVELAHERGCAAIVAHPYRNSTVRDVEDVPFDAIEVNGKHPRTRAWAERLAEDRGLPIVGGSDAHYPFEIGRAYTLVEADRLTPTTVVEAIRNGDVGVRVSQRLFHRLMHGMYERVHRRKKHLDRPSWATPGVGTPPGEDDS